MDFEIDVRAALPVVRVPTLVLQRSGDGAVPVEHGRYLARQIPGSKRVELPGDDHDPATTVQANEIADEIEEFLTGIKPMPAPDRVLTTVLFADIVESTELLVRLGDHGWRELLERHHALVRRELARFHGREIDRAGDGLFAAFDGPTRAIRCALAIREILSTIGLEIRAGLHIGECEKSGERLTGIAVHFAARVAASAEPNEIRVSSTLKNLVAGAGIQFVDCGRAKLKGIPEEWQMWSVS
jgi:class 3 adenylate cyclase